MEDRILKEKKNIAVQVNTWTKEKGYIKVLNPISLRLLFLTGLPAEVFELLDDGCDAQEILEEMRDRGKLMTEKQLDEVLGNFSELNLIKYIDQFDD